MTSNVLVVDWHDCLEDYTSAFLFFLQKKGVIIHTDDIDTSFSFMGIPDNYFVEFENSNSYRNLETIKGARKAIDILGEHFRIYCVSSSPGVIPMRYQLKFRFPKIVDFFYAKPKKNLITSLNALWIIDDQIPNLEVDCRAFAFSRPWNKTWTGNRGNWEEIIQYFETYVF